VDNIADAKTIADFYNICRFYVVGDITLDDNFDDYIFESHTPETSTIDLNNQSVEGAVFKELTITGIQNGYIQADTCKLDGIFNMNGEYRNCTVASNLDCKSGVWTYLWGGQATGADLYSINMNGAAKIVLNVTVQALILNMTNAGAIVLKEGAGAVLGNNTNTAGNILLTGEGSWIDMGVGPNVNVTNDTIRSSVWDEVLANHLTPGTTGKKLYDGGTGDPAEIAAAVWDASSLSCMGCRQR
jgi:hypothetical protein